MMPPSSAPEALLSRIARQANRLKAKLRLTKWLGRQFVNVCSGSNPDMERVSGEVRCWVYIGHRELRSERPFLARRGQGNERLMAVDAIISIWWGRNVEKLLFRRRSRQPYFSPKLTNLSCPYEALVSTTSFFSRFLFILRLNVAGFFIIPDTALEAFYLED